MLAGFTSLLKGKDILGGINKDNFFSELTSAMDMGQYDFETWKNKLPTKEIQGLVDELKTEQIKLQDLDVAISKSSQGLKGFASAFGTTAKSIALNIGVMAGITLAIKAAVWVFDELNVTMAEQQEIVDALSTNISDLEEQYDSLYAKKDKTQDEENQLKYLDRQLDVQKELYKIEQKRLADKELYGIGDLFSSGELKDLTSKSYGHGNEVYDLGLEANIDNELKRLENARRKISEAPNLNTSKYWDKEQDKSLESLKKYREELLSEWESSADSYNRIKRILDDGIYDDEPEKVKELQETMALYKADMDNLQGMTDKVEVSLGIKIDSSVDESQDKVDALKKEAVEPITIAVAISGINDLSDGFEKISSIYNDIKDKDDFDFGSLVDKDFVATFGEYEEAYNNFVNTVANSPTDIEACKEAFNDLTTEWFYGQDALKNITDETYNATVAMLEQKGVTNAVAIASSALAKSKIDAFLAGKDLTQITEEEIKAFLEENGVINVTNDMLEALKLAKITVNGSKLDFSSDIENIMDYVEKLGGTTTALKMLLDMKSQLFATNITPLDFVSANSGDLTAREKLLSGNSYTSQKASLSDIMANAKQEVQSAINSAMDIKVNYTAPPSSKSSSSSKGTDAYKAEIDAYKKLQDELAKIQSDIATNEKKYNNTKDDKEKIALLQQRIVLTQKEQAALHNLNNARDKGIASNVVLLKQKGFLVDYNPDSNELEIKNLEHLNDLKGKNQEKINELIKEYEDLIQTTQSLNEENRKSSESWWDSYYNLSKYKEEIEDLNRALFSDKINDLDFTTLYYDGVVGQEGKIIAIYKSIISEVDQELIRAYKQGLTTNDDYIQELLKKKKDYVDKNRDLNQQIFDNEVAHQEHVLELLSARKGTEKQQIDMLREMQENALKKRQELINEDYALNIDKIRNLEKAWKSYYDNILEAQKKALEEQKKDRDSALSAVTSFIDDEISNLQKEKDALSDQNDERERKLKLQELEANAEKARSQKTAYIYRNDRGFEYEADQSDINEAQNAIDDYKAEQALKAKQDALQKEIDSLQEYKEKWEEISNAVTEQENKQKAAMLLGSDWKSKILDLDSDSLTDFKDDYMDVEKSLNEKTTELANHLDTEFTRITGIFEKAAQSFAKVFGVDLGIANESDTSAENTGNETPANKEKSNGSIFDRIVNKVVNVFSLLTGETETHKDTLEDNNTNLKTSSDTQKTNTDAVKNNDTSVKDNTTNVKSNTTYLESNSNELSSNSITLETLITTINDAVVKIVDAADTVVKSNKARAEASESDSSSGSSSSGGSSSGGSSIGKTIGKVISGIGKVIGNLTKHHTGGVIGETVDSRKALFELSKQKLKPDEEVSVVQDGELILTKEQQQNIMDRLNSASYDKMLMTNLSSTLGNQVGYVSSNFNIPTGVIRDYSINSSDKNKITPQQPIHIENVNFSDIQEVKQIQEAILTLPQYVAQKSTSNYNR